MNIINRIKNGILFLIRDGFVHILLGNTLIKAISFVSTILIVRLVTKQDYAALVYADNLYSYVISICGFGLSSGLLIYCSRDDCVGRKKSVFFLSIKVGLASMAIGSTIVYFYHTLFGKGFENANILMLLLVLYPAGNFLVSCCSCFIRAHSDNRLFVKLSLIQTITVFILSFSLVLIIGIRGVPFARYCGIVMALYVALKYVYNQFSGVSPIQLDKTYIRTFITTSISLWIADICSSLMVSNETFLVNYLINDNITTANYKVAILIPSQLMFVASSITIYFFPKIARLKTGDEIWNYAKKTGIYTGLLMAVIVLIAMPLTPVIITIVFGDQYSDIKWLFNLFWIVYGINTAVRVVPWNVIAAIGREKFNASVSAVFCAIHLVVDYFSIVHYGVNGVAIASLLVYMASGTIAWIYLYCTCKRHAGLFRE